MDEICVVLGDITTLNVDCIVNAANRSLLGGGGVDGAIHRAAGQQLIQECRGLGVCETGDAKLTLGYDLAADYVIHTVGPVWQGGSADEDRLLAQCYRRCFQIAEQNQIRTIAFPAISTGAYRFPIERATTIAVSEATISLRDNATIEEVIFVCFDQDICQSDLAALS